MSSKTLNKSEIKQLNQTLNDLYGKEFFNKKDLIQITQNPIKHIKLNKEPVFFFEKEKPIPLLKLLLKEQFLKTITVDMGAIKFICNGADVMKPGITDLDENIRKGEIIVIVDEKNKKPLVVGETLYSGEEIKQKTDGKVIKNLHFITDNKWDLN
ncbi:RNA-binding protein [Candidatus Woesearchaeota archaeon]|jgi:PUA domain protein|nr:RNA-binding protein [Candidatus Woesearchaeota archaeon]